MKNYREKVTYHCLSNGLNICFLSTPDEPGFEIALHILAGSRDENKSVNGVFHFLEHMVFRGCKKYKNSIQLAHALESLGGENNGITDCDMTIYWLEGRNSKIIEGLELFADFFLNPNWSDLEIERSIIQREIESDYNEDGVLICPTTLVMNALFPKHPFGLPVAGTPESVKSITKDVLEKYRNTFYQPQNSLLTICTSLDADKILPLVETLFGQHWKGGTLKIPPRKPFPSYILDKNINLDSRVVCQNDSDNQFQLQLVFPTNFTTSKEYVSQNCLERLLDDGLAARLPAALREKHGLVYDISCQIVNYTDISFLVLDSVISKNHLQKSIKILNETLLDVFHRAPTPQEMSRIKERYGFDLDLNEHSHIDVLDNIVWSKFFKPNITFTEERELLAQINTTALKEAAEHIFSNPVRAAVLVGPNAKHHYDELKELMKITP